MRCPLDRCPRLFPDPPDTGALCAAGVNLAYALFNSGLEYRSWWFGTLAAFYAALTLLCLRAMGLDRRGRGERDGKQPDAG